MTRRAFAALRVIRYHGRSGHDLSRNASLVRSTPPGGRNWKIGGWGCDTEGVPNREINVAAAVRDVSCVTCRACDVARDRSIGRGSLGRRIVILSVSRFSQNSSFFSGMKLDSDKSRPFSYTCANFCFLESAIVDFSGAAN